PVGGRSIVSGFCSTGGAQRSGPCVAPPPPLPPEPPSPLPVPEPPPSPVPRSVPPVPPPPVADPEPPAGCPDPFAPPVAVPPPAPLTLCPVAAPPLAPVCRPDAWWRCPPVPDGVTELSNGCVSGQPAASRLPATARVIASTASTPTERRESTASHSP